MAHCAVIQQIQQNHYLLNQTNACKSPKGIKNTKNFEKFVSMDKQEITREKSFMDLDTYNDLKTKKIAYIKRKSTEVGITNDFFLKNVFENKKDLEEKESDESDGEDVDFGNICSVQSKYLKDNQSEENLYNNTNSNKRKSDFFESKEEIEQACFSEDVIDSHYTNRDGLNFKGKQIHLDVESLDGSEKVLTNFEIHQKNTYILVDWDDTLLSSSWLFKQGITLGTPVPPQVESELQGLDQAVTDFLSQATFLYGNVHIVTNAQEGWIEKSSEAFLPKVARFLQENNESIEICSARHKYEHLHPNDPASWKFTAFYNIVKGVMSEDSESSDLPKVIGVQLPVSNAVENLGKGSLDDLDLDSFLASAPTEILQETEIEDTSFLFTDTESESGSVEVENGFNFISIGDSSHDVAALRSLDAKKLAGELELRHEGLPLITKTVKFRPCPDLNQLIEQLLELTNMFGSICHKREIIHVDMVNHLTRFARKKRRLQHFS